MTDVMQKAFPKSEIQLVDVAFQREKENKLCNKTLNRLQAVFDNKKKNQFVLNDAIKNKHQHELEELKKELASGEFNIDSQLSDGRTPLFVVVCNGNFEAVKYLVEHGANMEIHENENGNTALMAAISLGYNEIVDYLIHMGANIHAVNNNGNTIIHFAAICGSLAILKYAHEHGCDINQKDNEGNCAILFAAGNNYKKVVEYLLKQNVILDVVDSEKISLFNVCLKHKRDEIYDLIFNYLRKNLHDIEIFNKNKNIIIHFASNSGDLEVLKYAHQHGCDINQKDSEGNCAILFATKNNYEKMVEYLLEQNVGIDVVDSDKLSLLHVCIQYNHNKILNSILYKNRSTLNKYYGDYHTALYWAASTDKFNSVFVLLKYGANPNLNDCLNHSPLFWAVFYQNYEMVEMLIDYGADIHCRYRIGGLAWIHGGTQKYGDSILRTAMRRWITKITDLIREKGGEDHREY